MRQELQVFARLIFIAIERNNFEKTLIILLTVSRSLERINAFATTVFSMKELLNSCENNAIEIFDINLQRTHRKRIDELQDFSLANTCARSKNRENFRFVAHRDYKKKIHSPIIAISVYRLSLARNAQDTVHTHTGMVLAKNAMECSGNSGGVVV